MNLPNKLTLLRVIMVPFFIAAFLMDQHLIALVLFALASITDFLDGKIARERNLVTNFGKIMDPLADKILVYSALCLFLEGGYIKSWMLIVLLAREFIIAGMRTVAASEGTVLAAGMSGKIKTALQMVGIIIMMLGLAIPQRENILIIGSLIFFVSIIAAVYSGVEYIIKNRKVFSM